MIGIVFECHFLKRLCSIAYYFVLSSPRKSHHCNGKYKCEANTRKYIPHLLVKFPSSWSCLLVFLLTSSMGVYIVFFFQGVRSCVKNLLKNNHAITYQNLFLRNDPDIWRTSAPSWNTRQMFLSCLLFCPSLVLPLSCEGETLKLKLATFLGSDTHRRSPYCSLIEHTKNTKSWTRCSGSETARLFV